MRFFNNQTSAAIKAQNLPFAGLGFDTDTVQAAAQEMTPVAYSHPGDLLAFLPAPAFVSQPSGYDLLVSLGREIRGR